MTEIIGGATLGILAGVLFVSGEPVGGISATAFALIYIGSKPCEEVE